MKRIGIFLISILASCDAHSEFSGATNHIHRNNSDHIIQVKGFVDGEETTELKLNRNQEYT